MVTKINKELSVQVKRLAHYQDLPFPSYATIHSSGLDLLSTKDLVLKPLQRCLVPTGLQIAIPVGYEGQVRPRSGLALKHGLTVVNTPGTIDADYRGEVCVILANLSTTDYEIKRGMRIAQLVFAPVAQAELLPVEELSATSRGTGGFGSTGI